MVMSWLSHMGMTIRVIQFVGAYMMSSSHVGGLHAASMRRAAIIGDLVVVDGVLVVQDVAAGIGARIAIAQHEHSGLVHVIEHDARWPVRVRKRRGVRRLSSAVALCGLATATAKQSVSAGKPTVKMRYGVMTLDPFPAAGISRPYC